MSEKIKRLDPEAGRRIRFGFEVYVNANNDVAIKQNLDRPGDEAFDNFIILAAEQADDLAAMLREAKEKALRSKSRKPEE